MNSDRKLSEIIYSGVNVIIARFMIAVFLVAGVVAALTYTGVFLTTVSQMNMLLLAALPEGIYAFLVLNRTRVRDNSKTKYILCALMCIQAFAVAMAAYSYVGTIMLLLPILLAALYPKSKLELIVSAVMICCGFILPPLALISGLWDGPYYEFLYDLANGRQMDTAILSSDLLSRPEQILSAIRFCSSQNVLIIGGFSFIGRLIYRQTNKSFDSQKDVIRLSETDELTGLLNRNCFERRLDEIAAFKAPGAACFYFDVNGLHEMNNELGHKAGDNMLQYVGKKIQDVFGEDNTFRVGGDEYVAFSGKFEPKSLPVVQESLKEVFESKGYHVAIGYAQSVEIISANELVQLAEKAMYQEKALYYIKNDRRR